MIGMKFGALLLVAAATTMVLVVSLETKPVELATTDKQMYENTYGDDKPAHVHQDYWHSDGKANHNRFKGVGMGNDAEPDGDTGFPAASFSARKSRGQALRATALEADVAASALPKKAGSGRFAKLFKTWVNTKIWDSKSSVKTASLKMTALGEDEEEEDEDETGELIFGFFILFLPLIVLVIVLLILLPFMIAKATGATSAPSDNKSWVPDGGDAGAKFNEYTKSTSDLVVKWLSPVEEMSPFKVGQIQKLISDVNEQAGTVVAPVFIVLQVLFLLAFVAYIVVAIVALCLDWEAIDCDCAADSWVWLYVLLVVVIPTSYGFIMGLVRAGLQLADLKTKFGWEVPDVFLTLPAPVIYITLGILGIILWSTMSEDCALTYSETNGMLFVIFKIQVIMMGVASIFGLMTVIAQITVLFSGGSSNAEPAYESNKQYV
jgi:hypothetical protein